MAHGTWHMAHRDVDGGVQQAPAACHTIQMLRGLLDGALLLQSRDQPVDLLLARGLRAGV